jgi:CheY-like chemotaxis protein
VTKALVLIADDELPIADVLAATVADAGYQAIIATHGREALDLARKYCPALVISDLMMPYVSGKELIAALHADAAEQGRQAIPVILLTAASMAQAYAAGANAVLRKPFNLSDIDALLHRFLGSPVVNGAAPEGGAGA